MTPAKAGKLMPPRTAQGAERKQQLLDAARSMFSVHGYTKTRVSDICEAAGVAKGLVHWYFPSKESLFIEILREMRQELNRAVDAATDPTADPLTRLQQAAEAYLRFMAVNHAFFTVVETRRAEPSLLEEISDWEASTDTRAAVLFAEAQELGLVPAGDPYLFALGAKGLVSGFVHTLRSQPSRFDNDEVVAFARERLLRYCAVAGR